MCPVNTYKDISLIIVAYGPQGIFFAAIPQLTTGGKIGCKARKPNSGAFQKFRNFGVGFAGQTVTDWPNRDTTDTLTCLPSHSQNKELL